jgi:hypothetical protein
LRDNHPYLAARNRTHSDPYRIGFTQRQSEEPQPRNFETTSRPREYAGPKYGACDNLPDDPGHAQEFEQLREEVDRYAGPSRIIWKTICEQGRAL